VALPQPPQQVRLGAVIAIAIAAGLGVWLGTRGSDHAVPIVTPTGASGTSGKQVVPITAAGLGTLAATLGRPIYWAGQMPADTYELTRLANGRVFVRYLPAGVSVGSARAELTVGTYQVPDALAAIERSAAGPQSVRLAVQRGGVAFYARNRPTNVYLAFAGAPYEVEVYDPDAAEARALVETGKIAPVPARSESTTAKLVSAGSLKTLARSLGHPVYWAGAKAGSVYELSEPSGRVYVRYLPTGTKAGANIAALTIGTYSVQNAFTATKKIAARPDSVQIPVTGGAIAFYARGAPSSVYLAFPGSNVQIEVYDPVPAEARKLVTSGKIEQIR